MRSSRKRWPSSDGGVGGIPTVAARIKCNKYCAMSIKLIHQIPSKDGYYLMRFHPTSGLHLVLIQTQLDGSRIMIPDNY